MRERTHLLVGHQVVLVPQLQPKVRDPGCRGAVVTVRRHTRSSSCALSAGRGVSRTMSRLGLGLGDARGTRPRRPGEAAPQPRATRQTAVVVVVVVGGGAADGHGRERSGRRARQGGLCPFCPALRGGSPPPSQTPPGFSDAGRGMAEERHRGRGTADRRG